VTDVFPSEIIDISIDYSYVNKGFNGKLQELDNALKHDLVDELHIPLEILQKEDLFLYRQKETVKPPIPPPGTSKGYTYTTPENVPYVVVCPLFVIIPLAIAVFFVMKTKSQKPNKFAVSDLQSKVRVINFKSIPVVKM
jgi:hypothetical protein